MLARVLKEDYAVEFRNYGEITIPEGTLTNHQTATGEDPAYNFVCEFSWVDERYPQIASAMKPDIENYGINIPDDKLVKALRVKFIYDDSGNCRDIFYSRHTKQKYCRIDAGNGFACWCSLTPDWEEPDCPLRTDLVIQILGRDGKVAVTERQIKVNGDFKTEKKCLFSWEHTKGHELEVCSIPIYRKEKTGYIIDGAKGFAGFVESSIGEDGIVHYTSGLTFEQYKEQQNNNNLIILNEEGLNKEIEKYKRFHQKVFEEISHDEFYRLYECLPPRRIGKRNGAFSFFMTEEWNMSLHLFCFSYKDKYYKGLRDIKISDSDLNRQIDIHLRYFTRTYEELNKLMEEYLHTHRNTGGTCEFDLSINDLSRAVIHKFHEKYGQCFMGKYNLYDDDRKNLRAELVAYEGQPVYNFEFDFVVPCNDEMLTGLIREHNRPKSVFNNKGVIDSIDKITGRIAELKGDGLVWA